MRHLPTWLGGQRLARYHRSVRGAGPPDDRYHRRGEGYLAIVEDPKGARLPDVREKSEFKTGHVPGTINVSRGRLEIRIWKPLGCPGKVDMNRKIYVQGATSGPATLAAMQPAVCRFRIDTT
jgi:hypothetical protein